MRSRILLAAGDAATREYAHRLLAELHDVVQVADGEAAWLAVRQRRPDLVLADVALPRLGGCTLVARLRADPGTAGLPIILISARTDDAAASDALDPGASDYLVTPFEPRELLARVNTQLELVRARDAAEQGRQELVRQLVLTQESERQWMSRELHNTIGQHLTALQLGLKLLERAGPSSTVGESTLARLAEVTATMARQVHALAAELRPTALHDLGVARTVQDYLADWSGRSDVTVDFHSEGLEGVRLPGHVETIVFRIVQEALSNVARHSHAQRVGVILERRGESFIAVIEDNGLGFDPASPARHDQAPRGLDRIKAHAALLGGMVTLESSPQGGTTVFARLPLGGQARP